MVCNYKHKLLLTLIMETLFYFVLALYLLYTYIVQYSIYIVNV